MKKLMLLCSLLFVLLNSNAQDISLMGSQVIGEIKNPLEWER